MPDEHAAEPEPGPDPAEVEAALNRVRPLILGHGGDAEITGIDDGVVSVAFTGACHACPNLPMTYVGPVRTALMEVPGVREVRSDQVHASRRALNRMALALGARPMDA
ncbi:MAG TPA: NifU family protein [Spirillospora sp.]